MGIQQNLLMTFTTAAFSPVTRTYTAPTSGTVETAPAGCANVVIECYGAAVGGIFLATGGGGYCKSTYACTGGKTINYTIGDVNGAGGTATGATSGTLAITAMVANTGGAAVATNGGTASGGNVTNTTGGNAAGTFGNGGNCAGPLGGAGGIAPTGSGQIPGGGAAATVVGPAGGGGASGMVVFTYT
jgi:hypothetical protein